MDILKQAYKDHVAAQKSHWQTQRLIGQHTWLKHDYQYAENLPSAINTYAEYRNMANKFGKNLKDG